MTLFNKPSTGTYALHCNPRNQKEEKNITKTKATKASLPLLVKLLPTKPPSSAQHFLTISDSNFIC